MVLNLSQQETYLDGEKITPTALQKLVLFDLAGQAGRIVTADALSELWGADGVSDNIISALVVKLRTHMGMAGDNLIAVRGRGYLLLHDKLTHLEGDWININGLALDLNSGLAISQDTSYMFTSHHIDIIRTLFKGRVFPSKGKGDSITVHISLIRNTFAEFPETAALRIIETLPGKGYRTPLAKTCIAAPLLPQHAIEALGHFTHQESVATERRHSIKKAFSDSVGKGEAILASSPPHAPVEHGSIRCDVTTDTSQLDGKILKVPPRALPLLSMLITAANQNAGITEDSLRAFYAEQSSRQYLQDRNRLNMAFLRASVADESARPYVFRAGGILRLIYPDIGLRKK